MNAYTRDWIFPPLDIQNVTPMRRVIEITAISCDYGLTYHDLIGPCRKRAVAWPRQTAMAICREMGRSYPEIGYVFRRDHSTVLHAIRSVEKRMTPELRDAMDLIRLRAEASS